MQFVFTEDQRLFQGTVRDFLTKECPPDEVRALLPATLDALAYLHGQNLVQGGLKPPNFLVVDDQLKLASDTIRPAGERTASTAKPSLYDPPEAKNGGVSTAGGVACTAAKGWSAGKSSSKNARSGFVSAKNSAASPASSSCS